MYRSVLDDPGGHMAAGADSQFWAWLDSKGIDADRDEAQGPDGTTTVDSVDRSVSVQIRRTALRRGKSLIGATARYRLVEESPVARWTTTLTTFSPAPEQLELLGRGEGPAQTTLFDDAPGIQDGWVWLDLQHDGSERPPRPGSPRLIRDLMATGEANDSGVPLTAEPLSIRAGHVAELLSHITSPSRQIPILVFAHDTTRAYDQATLSSRLARDLAGVASVFVLGDAQTNEDLSRSLPDGLAVFAGALRTYLPGAGSADDSPNRHRILGRNSISALKSRAFPAVKDQVLQISTSRAMPALAEHVRRLGPERPGGLGTPAIAPAQREARPALSWVVTQLSRIRSALGRPTLERLPRELESAQGLLEAEIDRLLAAAGEVRADAPQAVSAEDLVARLSDLESDRDAALELLTEAEQEREQALADLHDFRSRLSEADLAQQYLELDLSESLKEVDRATRRLRFLEKQVRELGAPTWGEDDLPPAAPSVTDVLDQARTHLSHVVIGDTGETAAALDLASAAEVYALKTWEALRALDDYAERRADGSFLGSFYQ